MSVAKKVSYCPLCVVALEMSCYTTYMQLGQGEQENFWQQSAPQGQQQPAEPSNVQTVAASEVAAPDAVASPQPATDQSPTSVPAPGVPPVTAPVTEAEPAPAPPPPKHPAINIQWEASEFIQHSKSPLWFLAFAVFGAVILALGILVLKDWFVTIGFIFMLVAIAVVAVRKPRVLKYALDDSGVHVGDKSFQYSQFHSFGLVQESGLWSVVFMPNARFSPTLSIYFDQEQGEEIVDALSQFLPMEEHKVDMVDKFSRKIRF